MKIAVVDGMGGSIGHQIILELRRNLPEDTEIIALGANAIATGNMMKARANRGNWFCSLTNWKIIPRR